MRPITKEEAKEIVKLNNEVSREASIQKYCELVEIEDASLGGLLKLNPEDLIISYSNMVMLGNAKDELLNP